MRYFVTGVIAIVVIGIFLGFVSIGSPQAQRERRFDLMRVSHLQMMQSELLRYWQSKGVLPDDFSQLKDDMSGWQAPADPVTGESYRYLKQGDASFSLCANFMRQGEETDGASYPMMRKPMMPSAYPRGPFGMMGDTWSHGSGSMCFDRAIDEELYPVLPPPKRKVP